MAGRWKDAWVAAAAVLAWCASAEAQPAPVEAYGRLPAIADAAISPDGTKVVLAMSQGGVSAINVVDIDRGESVFATRVHEDTRLRGVDWADANRVSFVVSQTFRPGAVLPPNVRFRGRPTRVDYFRTGVVDLDTGRTRLLTTNADEAWQDQGSFLVAPIEGDADHARMIGRAPGVETVHPAVYRVSLSSGRSRIAPVRGVGEGTVGFLLDERGEVAVRIDSDEETNRWSIHVYDGETPRLLLEDVSATGHPPKVQALTADGRIAVLFEDEAGEYFRLYAVDPASGAKQVLFEREGFEVSGAITDPWTRRVVGVAWIEEEHRQQFFEPALQEAYERMSAVFAAGAGSIVSWSRDRRRILVYGELGLDGGGYYVFTPADASMTRLSMRYPEIGAEGERQSISYAARDGTRIPAYLTLPGGREARNLPAVVLVHGGPHSRDTMDFDWWSAFLASRGYAVLQPNFRGSTGYGASWENAGRGQWGALMQTDVEDGAEALARAGIIDAERVCIVGGSYGGYAALAGAALTPNRYKCAVSVAGVFDLERMLRRDEAAYGEESAIADYWRLSIGDRREDRDAIRAVSPAHLAERVVIPVLLMHGTEDTTVPIRQSRIMQDRLRDAGKEVRFVELDGDDHHLSDPATRIEMLRELEAFLAQHLGPAP